MNTRYDKILEFILKLSLEFHAKLLEAMLIDSAIRLLKFDKLISAGGKGYDTLLCYNFSL